MNNFFIYFSYVLSGSTYYDSTISQYDPNTVTIAAIVDDIKVLTGSISIEIIRFRNLDE